MNMKIESTDHYILDSGVPVLRRVTVKIGGVIYGEYVASDKTLADAFIDGYCEAFGERFRSISHTTPMVHNNLREYQGWRDKNAHERLVPIVEF